MNQITRQHTTLIAGILLTGILTGQSPIIEWQNSFGGALTDYNVNLIATNDGGYLMLNNSFSNSSTDKAENAIGGEDFWLVKLDASGEIEWENTIGGTSDDMCLDGKQLPDGSYIIGGRSYSNISADKSENRIGMSTRSDIWVIKLDAAGNKIWDNTIGGILDDNLSSIELTNDNGFILLGQSSSGISVDKTTVGYGFNDYWMVKLDSNGTKLWDKSFGGTDIEWTAEVICQNDGSYLIAGTSYSGISGNKSVASYGASDYWILKLDSTGNQLWQKAYGGSSEEVLTDIYPTNDQGFIIAGHSNSSISGVKSENRFGIGGSDIWMVKIDSTGVLQWENTIGGNEYENISNVFQNDIGELFLIADSNSPISGDKTENSIGPFTVFQDYWVLKLSETGEIIWQKIIGGSGHDYVGSAVMQLDGSFTIAGKSASATSFYKNESPIGGFDPWIIKLYPEACPLHAQINVTPDSIFCKPDAALLSTQYDATLNYQWRRNGSNIGGATSFTYNAIKSGNYSVKINNGICTKISDDIQVSANPKPVVTINNVDVTNNLCVDAAIKLKTSNGAGYTFQWFVNDTAIVGATNYLYTATAIGIYKVKVTNAYSCFNTSAAYEIINSCKLAQLSSINVFPNPFTALITITIPENFPGMDNITLIDINGIQVFYEKIQTSTTSINLEHLPSGIYFIRFNQGDQFMFGNSLIKN